jgi:hypothetical protein
VMLVMLIWHESYRAAALETDWTILPERIFKARSDMHNRLLSLPSSSVNEALQIAQGLTGLVGLAQDMLLWQGAQAFGVAGSASGLPTGDWQEPRCEA